MLDGCLEQCKSVDVLVLRALLSVRLLPSTSDLREFKIGTFGPDTKKFTDDASNFLSLVLPISMLRSLRSTFHTPLRLTFTFTRTMSNYTATQPSTLQEALERINHLESQLLLAHRLFHEHTSGLNLQDYLPSSSSNRSPSPPYRSVSQTSSESPSPSPIPDSEEPTQPTPKGQTVDIGTFVLRALALRKKLTIGEIDSLEGERELGNMIKGSGMTDKQENQVREWAGLL